MKEDQFEMFLNSSINNFSENYIDISGYSDEPCEFSEKFRRKMKKLVKRRKHFYFPAVKTGFRRGFTVIVTVIVMMFSVVMSVGALRRTFFSFVTKPFADHTDVELSDNGTAPETISENYMPGFAPDGFVLRDSCMIKDYCNTLVYSDGNSNIEFTQWVRSQYTLSVNTEGYDMEKLEINGCEGFGIDMTRTGRYLLSWDRGDYVFQIVGRIDRDTAVKMAESLRKQN